MAWQKRDAHKVKSMMNRTQVKIHMLGACDQCKSKAGTNSRHGWRDATILTNKPMTFWLDQREREREREVSRKVFVSKTVLLPILNTISWVCLSSLRVILKNRNKDNPINECYIGERTLLEATTMATRNHERNAVSSTTKRSVKPRMEYNDHRIGRTALLETRGMTADQNGNQNREFNKSRMMHSATSGSRR